MIRPKLMTQSPDAAAAAIHSINMPFQTHCEKDATTKREVNVRRCMDNEREREVGEKRERRQEREKEREREEKN